MTKLDRKLLSPAAYARHRGVTRPAVARAIREQRITLSPEGLLDPVVADAQWQANTRPVVRSTASAQALRHAEAVTGIDLQHDIRHWKTRNARADALQAEISLAAKQAKYIELDPLIELLQRMSTVLRTLLLAVPSRIAQELPGTHDDKATAYGIAMRLQCEALVAIADGPLEELEAQAEALRAAEDKAG